MTNGDGSGRGVVLLQRDWRGRNGGSGDGLGSCLKSGGQDGERRPVV